jgi:polysaccharide export outer membrane protein
MRYPAHKKRIIEGIRNTKMTSNFILTVFEINRIKILNFIMSLFQPQSIRSPFSIAAIRLFVFANLFNLSSCVAPVYENTTYDIEEFTLDSQQIAQGKFAILALEEKESVCYPDSHFLSDDIVIEGDELSITLYCPERPDRMLAVETINARTGFRVCNGNICLPHLPSLEVTGLTLNEVRDRLQTAYCEQLPHARVFVNFHKRRERIVQIIGANLPMVAVDGRMRLSEVLAKADLSPYANLFKSYVMRNGEQLPLDLYKLVHEGDESQNIVMQGGDQIFIANARDASVMVMGEVGQPIVVPVPYGFISLREALAIASGIPFTGNKNCIQVIRGDLTRPKIYSLAWNDMMRIPNRSLLLMPGDVVVISERPITQWNRFIDQLQPSTDCMQTTCNIYELTRATR